MIGRLFGIHDIGLLFLRVTAGLTMIIAHGIGKIQKPDGFVGLITDMGFPLPKVSAYLAIAAETIFPLMIVLGLLTRISAAIAAINMFVAGIVFHLVMKGDPFSDYEKAMLYFFIFVTLTITGSGKYSVDKLFKN
ncbi:MAG: DoxX family protein [Candidatus Dadabacteria bacterium]|nr:DoxX family protein [Candidatus Dadabacteria bacterium]NIS08757.1 DoxX family protein [Candidatus Dadabacteria bacterium]NIV42700.1 DoxX family membrane protein [Candidatus Dadabacteria bacterium]NIX15443.1 DoxX family membrane protein [Candidatus Dadabacteria bacterium]NIY22105.1 DoxX family membrane protein [Candidatus Dadabacteria bacterium]